MSGRTNEQLPSSFFLTVYFRASSPFLSQPFLWLLEVTPLLCMIMSPSSPAHVPPALIDSGLDLCMSWEENVAIKRVSSFPSARMAHWASHVYSTTLWLNKHTVVLACWTNLILIIWRVQKLGEMGLLISTAAWTMFPQKLDWNRGFVENIKI